MSDFLFWAAVTLAVVCGLAAPLSVYRGPPNGPLLFLIVYVFAAFAAMVMWSAR